jgi:hypothetical protein
MWNRYFALLVMAALIRADFELSRQARTQAEPKPSYLLGGSPDNLHQKEWSEKAVKRYAAAQERKWRRWREAMFEAK